MAKKADVRTKALTTKQPEVLDAVTAEEVKLVVSIGTAIAQFAKDALAFFTTAKAIELDALETLARMKARPAPATAEEDEALQLEIQNCNRGKKTATEHWHQITSVVFQFHRRLTGRRDVAVKAYDEGANIGNVRHNKFADEARRAAEVEQNRIRQEAEDKARADRDRELDALEAKALELEGKTEELSDREQVYVNAVVDGFAPLAAAKRAGYKDPGAVALRLQVNEKLKAAIEAVLSARRLRAQQTAAKAMPLDVEVEQVKPDLVRAVGAKDVTRYSAEFTDEAAFIVAVFEGKHGIPRDVLVIDHARVNQYARDMEELINKWPGVRAKRTTKVQ